MFRVDAGAIRPVCLSGEKNIQFPVLYWNIEHFKASAVRLKKVATHIRKQSPDVLCLPEVESVDMRTLMEKEFAGYDFALTDGLEVQESLVGWADLAGISDHASMYLEVVWPPLPR